MAKKKRSDDGDGEAGEKGQVGASESENKYGQKMQNPLPVLPIHLVQKKTKKEPTIFVFLKLFPTFEGVSILYLLVVYV